MDLTEFGQTLRLQRKSLGFSQQTVADAVGLARPTLSKIETGQVPDIGIRKLMRLAEHLGLRLILEEDTFRPTLQQLINENRQEKQKRGR
ncbi:helix-turn-helix domain-containing protein [Leeia sp. TBRC 13508]|uniref:Helix-turn-helix domain-containing protein n=1 Tax=Leeia speluncae TaxID=2884804 RepID=A0ABS8D9N1_9NEIS|nr:helix-turn-helix transcriptional regulator [Leeia speluncae]MCB6184910.1 helix-turn-helix domain-containing protein [Leeia speluncae]